MMRNLKINTGSFMGLSGVILFTLFCIAANAQQADNSVSEACKELPVFNNDFVLLDDVKSTTQKTVAELEQKKKSLEEEMPKIERAQKDFDKISEDIKSIKDNPKKLTQDVQNLADMEKEAGYIQDNVLKGRTAGEYKEELKQVADDYSWKKEQLRCINSSLSKMLSPEQDFKKTMSMVFALLIGIVIIGFFVVSYVDINVRRTIFAGQSGLQFLTLFSIVIAIILFGITNILQDKELAALLGGLSGYILGRYSSRDNENASQKNLPKTIEISPATVSLSAANSTQQLSAVVQGSLNTPLTPGNYTLNWTSDNPAVATVDQTGLVTRVSAGTCNISAALNGITSNGCSVTCT